MIAQALLFLILYSQPVVVDSDIQFRFNGRVSNADGSPVSGVEVFFTDTHLEENHKARIRNVSLGDTNEEGKFRASYRYNWSRSYPSIKAPEEGHFTLVFRRSGYRRATLKVEIRSLACSEGACVVPFDFVLRRETTGKNGGPAR